jgi:hypothetical protein
MQKRCSTLPVASTVAHSVALVLQAVQSCSLQHACRNFDDHNVLTAGGCVMLYNTKQVAVEQLCSAVVVAGAAVSPFDSTSALLHHAVSVLLSNSLIESRTEHCSRSSSCTCDCASESGSSSSSNSNRTCGCNDSTTVRADSAHEDVVVYVRVSAKQVHMLPCCTELSPCLEA